MRKVEAFMKPWQVSRYLGIPIDEIHDMLEKDELPGTKIEGSWRIRRTELEKWLDEGVTKEDLVKLSKRVKEIDEGKVQEFIEKTKEDAQAEED